MKTSNADLIPIARINDVVFLAVNRQLVIVNAFFSGLSFFTSDLLTFFPLRPLEFLSHYYNGLRKRRIEWLEIAPANAMPHPSPVI
jgi:hypothetical protein